MSPRELKRFRDQFVQMSRQVDKDRALAGRLALKFNKSEWDHRRLLSAQTAAVVGFSEIARLIRTLESLGIPKDEFLAPIRERLDRKAKGGV